MSFDGPLFLVGMPRSGTKLLRDLLNRHPCIAIPQAETEFLPWLAAWVRRHGEPSDRPAFDALWSRLRQQQFFVYRYEAGGAISADAWYGACRRFDAAGLFEALVRLDTGASEGSGRIWGDKSPSYIDDLPLIRTLYPRARVLHIVRDVRDHCLSIHNAWGKDMLRAAQQWADGVEAARAAGAQIGTDYLEVRYEDLLDEPEAKLRQVCNFVDIEFMPAMTTLTRASENLGDTRGARRVVAGNHGKYRDRLAPATLRQIEALAGSAMERFGYARSCPSQPQRRMSRLALLRSQAHDALNLVQHERAQRGVVGALMFHLRRYRTVHSEGRG